MVYDILCGAPEPVFKFEMVVISTILFRIVFHSNAVLLKTLKLTLFPADMLYLFAPSIIYLI